MGIDLFNFKKIEKIRIRENVLAGFSFMIFLIIFLGFVGFRGIREIGYQKHISDSINSFLIDFLEVQIVVLGSLYSDEGSHIESVEEEIGSVLSQANMVEDLILNKENNAHIKALIHSIMVYRDLSMQLSENQEFLNSYYESGVTKSEIIISDIRLLLSYAEGYFEDELFSGKNQNNSIEILYGLQDLRNAANRFRFNILRVHNALSQEEIDLYFTAVNLEIKRIRMNLLNLKQTLSDPQMLSYLNEIMVNFTEDETVLRSFKAKSLYQYETLSLLEDESDNIILKTGNIRNNVDEIIAVIKDRYRNIAIILSFLSTASGVIIALILTLAMTRQLGAEPFEIEEVASKISQGNFHVRFPERDLSGVFLSIKRMMEKLAETTASKDELEAEIIGRKGEEQKYRNLFDRMTEGFATHEIIVDTTGRPVDYRFLSLNPAFEKLLGLKASDIIGKTVLDVLPGIEPDWVEKLGNVALTGEPIQFEDYSSIFNRYYSLSAYCPVKGEFALSLSDITDRILAEEALENKNELLSVTLKSIGDGVITTDNRGDITFINTVSEDLTGWTNQEACGKPLEKVFHIIHEKTKERCVNPAQKVLETGEVIELANHTCLISKKGEWHVIEDSAAPIRDHDQNILGVIIVFRDTTEKKKLKESVQNIERLESLGVLAGGIAHDFNNYLAGIFGYVELVNNRLETGTVEKNRGYLLKVLNISERAKSLTQQLLTFSKGGKPNKALTSLDEIIRTSVRFALSGTSIVSHLSIEEDLWSCLCDENRISQCIDNLVINAIQAMPEGGALSFTARNALEVPSRLGGDAYIEMIIEDTGTGIPSTLLEKIFDPFFSTKKEGNGLGLATVFSIIKNHDGWIDVQSEPGVGSSFTLYLPASRSEKALRSGDMVIDYKAGTGHILVLDDKEYILEILKDMIEAMGYAAILTEKSDEAIRIIKEDSCTGGMIKACILDQTLPGDLYGHEVARKIHEIAPELPLIASSGYVESDVMTNPRKYHFAGCISKPFDFRKLSEILYDNIVESEIEIG